MPKTNAVPMSRTVMANVCLMAFATWAPMYCVPPMEYILKDRLLLTHAQTSLLFTIPTLMLAAVGIPGGLLADRIGAKKAIGIGAIIMVIGAALRVTATSAANLLVFTFVYGAGIGLSFPNLPKMIGVWIAPEKAGMAMGIYTAIMFAGQALAVAITNSVIFPITHSFQGVFLLWSAPLAVAVILWWVLVKEPPHPGGEGDSVGRTPLHQVLRNQNLWLLAIVLLMFSFFNNTWVGWAPTLLMLKGAAPGLSGLMASLIIWFGIPAALFMPRLSYRLGVRKPFLWAGMITLAVSAWVAMKVSLSLSWPLMAVSGFAISSMLPIIFAMPVEMMPKKFVGVASGLVISIGQIGAVVGPLIGGRILDQTGNLNPALAILIGIAVAAAGIAFRLPETGRRVLTISRQGI